MNIDLDMHVEKMNEDKRGCVRIIVKIKKNFLLIMFTPCKKFLYLCVRV